MKKIIAPICIASLIMAHLIIRFLFAGSMMPAKASSSIDLRANIEHRQAQASPVQAHLVLQKDNFGTKDAEDND